MTDNANYSYISTIVTPDSTTHYVKDAEARAAITELETTGVKFQGFSSTTLTDGATTTPIDVYVSGSSGSTKSLTPSKGDFVIYKKPQGTDPETYISLEFMWNGSSWGEYGSTGALKKLAFKDSASGNYDKATGITVNSAGGTITTTGTLSGNPLTSTGTFTPSGTITKPNVSVSENKSSFVTSVNATVANETLTIGSSTSQAVTSVSASLASAPEFNGDPGDVSVTGTPGGSVSVSIDTTHSHLGSVTTSSTAITVQ